MDASLHRQFASFFKSLPEKPQTTIRLFNRQEFYTAHGEDAVFAAKEVFRTTSVIKSIEQLEQVTLNKGQFETFVRDLLLVKQYRVEVFVNKGGKSGCNWVVEYKGSPGNLAQFEDVLFSNAEVVDSTALLSVRIGSDGKCKTVGVALVDMVEHNFSLSEFTDDDQLTNLEGILVQFGPKECVVGGEAVPVTAILKKVVERCGILLTSRKKSEFATDSLCQDLNKLIKFEEGQQEIANALPQMSHKLATSALAAAVKYLELCSDSENFAQFTMSNLEHGRFVHLDSAALSALSLVGSGTQSQGSNRTLIDLLDKCRTSHGHRLLAQWVKQPLKDVNVINERHDIVEMLTQETMLRQTLYEDHLRRIPDFQVLGKKLQRKKATLQDCYRIYQGVDKLPSLIKCLEEYPNPTLNTVIVEPLNEMVSDMEKFQEMVTSTIDLDLVDRGEFLVKAEFDEDLQELRGKMDEIENKLQQELHRVARDLRLEANKGVKLDSNSQYGYFLRVTLKDEKLIRSNKEYTQLDANKTGVRFRSPKITRLNDEYETVRENYTEHQKSVVAQVISIAVSYCEILARLSRLLAQLDVLCSLSMVAACAPGPYVRPKMLDKSAGVLRLVQARHPCLEQIEGMAFIPNDVNLKRDESSFSVITGPSMGGKSTYIRSVGVIALLAHIGSLVPCDEAEVSLLDAILARVGAQDSQLKAMSTFMVEMVETSTILKASTPNSLVIIDELGRGTSTYEGCGIAWAIAEYLATEVKCFCLFATHFHELTRLADQVDTVKNFHVTALTSEDSLTLLYQVQPGACDQSFGIHVAQMAKFPKHVLEAAKEKLASLEDFKSLVSAPNDSKKRKIIQEGEQIISDFVQKCKKIASSGSSDVVQQVEELKQQLIQQDNAYVNELMKHPL